MPLPMQERKNSISSLNLEDGTTTSDQKDISKNNCNDFLRVINKISTCVFNYDNDYLITLFSMKEFKRVLFERL